MFIVRITFSVKPEEVSNLKGAAQSCIEHGTKAQGCLAYEFLKVVNGNQGYVLYEEWESQKDFEAYKASPDFKRVGDILTPFLAGIPVNTYFKGDKIEL